MTEIANWLLSLPPYLLLFLAFLLPAAEASLFVGVLVPGETVVLLAGVLAQAGVLPLWAVMVAATAGALLGDQVGFWVGRRYGPALLERMPRWLHRRTHPDQVLALVRRRGVLAVVLGRWTASLRALVPGIAGMSGLHPRTFTLGNATGGVVWGVSVALLGYLAGAGYRQVEHRLNLGGGIALGGLLVVLGVFSLVKHLRRRTRGRISERTEASDAGQPGPSTPSDGTSDTASPTTTRN